MMGLVGLCPNYPIVGLPACLSQMLVWWLGSTQEAVQCWQAECLQQGSSMLPLPTSAVLWTFRRACTHLLRFRRSLKLGEGFRVSRSSGSLLKEPLLLALPRLHRFLFDSDFEPVKILASARSPSSSL